MKDKAFLLFLLGMLSCGILSAQTGNVKGTIIDAQTREGLIQNSDGTWTAVGRRVPLVYVRGGRCAGRTEYIGGRCGEGYGQQSFV